ncbi:hypothetical protein F5141DRAFT_1060877 [Pisolithus sp. B1]|nr:hypothetical protein F5141DRAFT_1060877 [Pisolithus sp. B1]
MLDATNPTDHELAGTNPPDHDIHETSPAGHEGLAHYDGPATSTPPSPLELPSPAVNAAPVDDDATAPPPVLDTSGEEILVLFGLNHSPLESSHSFAELPQEME